MKRVITLVLIAVLTMTATVGAKSLTDGLKSVSKIELPDSEFDGAATFMFKVRNNGRAVCLFRCGDMARYALEMDIRDAGIGDEYWTPRAVYTLYKYNGYGQAEMLAEQSVDGDVVAAGLKIYQGFYGLRFTGIGGEQLFEYSGQTVPPLSPGTVMELYTDRHVKTERITDSFTTYPEREVYTVNVNAVDTATSPYSGTWEYLDRVMPAGKVILAGKYRLELYPDPDSPGDYIAVYTDGARVDNRFWHSGDVKARLRATPFEGHFNVVWYDSRRRRLADEVSATFESKDILRIDFPLLSTQIRFYRTTTEL